MTKLNVRDSNTGKFLEIDVDSPTGSYYTVDAETGKLKLINLTAKSGSFYATDANTGKSKLIDSASLSGNIYTRDDNTGKLVNINLASPSGSIYVTDENTGKLVLVELSKLMVFNSNGSGLSVVGGGALNPLYAGVTCPDISPTLGAELIVNGDMSSATGWIQGTGWSIGSGVATAVLADGSLLRQQPATAGLWYSETFDLVSRSANGVRLMLGTNSVVFTAPGSKAGTGKATSVNVGLAGESGGFSGVVENVSVKEITFSTTRALLGDLGQKSGTYICKPTVATHTQCGFVIEYADANNLVLVYVDRLENKTYLEKIIGGVSTAVISGVITYSAGADLKVIVSGNDHTLYYNGTKVGSTTAIADAGLGTKVYGFNTFVGNTVGLVTANP